MYEAALRGRGGAGAGRGRATQAGRGGGSSTQYYIRTIEVQLGVLNGPTVYSSGNSSSKICTVPNTTFKLSDNPAKKFTPLRNSLVLVKKLHLLSFFNEK